MTRVRQVRIMSKTRLGVPVTDVLTFVRPRSKDLAQDLDQDLGQDLALDLGWDFGLDLGRDLSQDHGLDHSHYLGLDHGHDLDQDIGQGPDLGPEVRTCCHDSGMSRLRRVLQIPIPNHNR